MAFEEGSLLRRISSLELLPYLTLAMALPRIILFSVHFIEITEGAGERRAASSFSEWHDDAFDAFPLETLREIGAPDSSGDKVIVGKRGAPRGIIVFVWSRKREEESRGISRGVTSGKRRGTFSRSKRSVILFALCATYKTPAAGVNLLTAAAACILISTFAELRCNYVPVEGVIVKQNIYIYIRTKSICSFVATRSPILRFQIHSPQHFSSTDAY